MGQRGRRRKASLEWGASFVAFGALAVLVGMAPAGPAAAMVSVSGSDGPGGTVSVGASDGGSSPGTSGTPGTAAGTGRSGPTRNGSGGGSGTAGASPWVCTSTSLLLNDEGGFAPGGPTPGGWFSVTCFNRVTGASTTQTEWITSPAAKAPPTPSAATPTVAPRVLALQAERSLRLPAPLLHFNPAAASVVNLPTWLWVDPSVWHPLSVTASAGPVSATAVATPEAVTWQMGDGGAVVCAGPGRPFDPALPAEQQATSCGYTFRSSSLGQPSTDGNPDAAAYTVRATITWAVSWTAQGAPGQGVLPSLSTDGTASVRVVQIESINSGLFGLSTGAGPSGSGEGPS
jgi:hypothetical protein